MSMINSNSHTDRHEWSISFSRMIAMMFIIICHFFQYYGNELAFWFNVGVQMFFCISGFLYGQKQIKNPLDFIVKNFKKILVPYFCFLLPAIMLYFLFARGYISFASAVRAVLCSGTIDGIGHLWFISYILFCYVITPYLYAFCDKLKGFKCKYVLVIFLFVLMLGQVLFIVHGSFFVFSRLCCYIIGYFLSFLLNQYGYGLFKLLSYILSSVCFVANAVRIVFKYLLQHYFWGFNYFEQYSHVLLGISIFLIIYILLKNIKKSNLLIISDKYSYYIYIVHQLLILSPFSLMAITPYMYLNWILVVFGIVVLAILLKIVSDKAANLVTVIEKLFERHLV